MKKIIYTLVFLSLQSLTNFAQTNADNPTRQHINEKIFVTDRLGIGYGMVNGYSFGISTFALVENNLRILFEDTSTDAEFPSNDWQIEINSNLDGGDNYFRINDITGVTSPFTIMAAAPDSSLFVNKTYGNVGFGTSNPEQHLHIRNSDSPTIRLQPSSYRFWDIIASEMNFEIKNFSGLHEIPVQISPNAPDNSIGIRSNGNVGIGTFTPDNKLEVIGDAQVNDYVYFGDESTDGNWRISVIDGNLTFEKREAGVWVNKVEMK